MPSAKPTVVLVPGAWHTPEHYSELIALLKAAGYDTVTAKNPSCDSSTPDKQTVAADTTAIRNDLLVPQIDAGKDVILIMHSYGGCPGSAAAKGLSKAELSAAGKKGGIVGLVFIAAFLAQEGDSLLSKLPGNQFDPWVIQHESTGQLSVEDPKSVFYADVLGPRAESAISQLKNQSRASLSTPSGPPAWPDSAFDGRRAYCVALNDACIPAIAQQMMLKYSGVEWSVKELESGHSPFLSRPEELSAWIVERTEGFEGA